MLSQVQRSKKSRAGSLSLLSLACMLACAGGAQAQTDLNALRVSEPGGARFAASDAGTSMERVIVQFAEAPVARMRPNMNVLRADRNEMRAYAAQLRAAKAPRLLAVQQLGGRVQNTVEFVLNGAVVDMPRNRIAELQRLPGVKSVRPARIYQMNQTTPPSVGELIRTAQVNAAGNGGRGVAIAVIDSGVDYTHAAFGGPGTVAVYQTNVAGTNPTTIGAHNAGLFPGGPRVKGGYDWLGDTWSGSAANPGGLLVTPDPNPIDNKQLPSDFAGHGTNSASAAAGSAAPAGMLRAGSAPEAMILAYRACSRISSACEGSALLNSVESVIRYAAGQPNDGQTGANNPPLPAGTRFVINMSLGATYGNPLIDDLSEASRNAVRAGISVVASAGNSGDIPFITGSPSSADQVIAVAASQPALLTGPALQVGSASYPLVTASFGIPLAGPLTAPLAFAGPNVQAGNDLNLACSGTLSGTSNPGPADPPIPALSGAVGLADRGICGFNEKALNIQRAGGSVALIANNAVGGGPIGMAAGPAGPSTTIPSYSIGTAEGAAVKAALRAAGGVLSGTFNPLGDVANIIGGINVVDQISDFSSRGAAQNNGALKPDVTAPGSNIFMAAIGTGDKGGAASGTSFSAPLTSGAAALVLSARPTFTPWQVKAALMNTANPSVFQTKATGALATVTRMGAGRIDAERAVATQTLAWDGADVDPGASTFFNPSLSFGHQAFTAAGASSVSRTVVVQNLGTSARTYSIGIAPRFANDTTKGISWSTSTSSLSVPAGGTASFQVTATAVGAALPTSGGFPVRLQQADTCTTTANPPAPDPACTNKFNDVEQDGFVTIDGGDDANRVTVPYLMMPRQASLVTPLRVGTSVTLRNNGVANSVSDVFTLVGAPDAKDLADVRAGAEEFPVDVRALGVRYLPNAIASLPTGISRGDVVQFAVTLHQPIDLLRLATMNIEIDNNGDGVTDFTVRNLTTTANRQVAFVSAGVNGAPGSAFFNVGAPVYTTRLVLSVFAQSINVFPNTRMGLRLRTTNGFSTAFALPTLDRLPDNNAFLYVTPNALVNNPSAPSVTVPNGTAGRFTFTSNAANLTASPGDKGFLLIHGENPTGSESSVLQLVN